MLYGRSLPSRRIALTACVPGPSDEAGRETVEFRSIVMSSDDWTYRVRHDVHRLLCRTFWSARNFEHGASLCVEPGTLDEQGPSPGAELLGRAVALGIGPVMLVESVETQEAMIGMLGSVTDTQARRLRWGLRLMRAVPHVDIATVAPAAPMGSSKPITIERLSEIVIDSESHQVSVLPESAGGTLMQRWRGSTGWPAWLPVILFGLVVGLFAWGLWMSWPKPAEDITRVVGQADDFGDITAEPVKNEAVAVPAAVAASPLQLPASPAATEVSQEAVPSEVLARPIPPLQVPRPMEPAPSDDTQGGAPADGEASLAVPTDPAIVEEALDEFNRAAFQWCEYAGRGLLTPTTRRHCINQAVSLFYDSTDGWMSDPAAGSEAIDDGSLCSVMRSTDAADTLWAWMGNAAPPAWASIEATKRWLLKLPPRPKSRWIDRVNARIASLQACQSKLATFSRFIEAMQYGWLNGAGPERSLSRAVQALVEYGSDCDRIAADLLEVPPGQRWPVAMLPSKSVAESRTFLQLKRDAVTKPKE